MVLAMFSCSLGVEIDIVALTCFACLRLALVDDRLLRPSASFKRPSVPSMLRLVLPHRFDFAPFGFSVLRSFGPVAKEILTGVSQRNVSQARISLWEAHQRVYRRLSFTVCSSSAI